MTPLPLPDNTPYERIRTPTRQLIAQIAEALNDTEPPPLEQSCRLITVMGVECVQELLREMQAVEAAGGLFSERENRRRAAGGVFFSLAQKRLTSAQRRRLYSTECSGQC